MTGTVLPFVIVIAGRPSGGSGACPQTVPATAKSVAVSSSHLPRPKLFPLGEGNLRRPRLDWKPGAENALTFDVGYLRSVAGRRDERPIASAVAPFSFLHLENETTGRFYQEPSLVCCTHGQDGNLRHRREHRRHPSHWSAVSPRRSGAVESSPPCPDGSARPRAPRA